MRSNGVVTLMLAGPASKTCTGQPRRSYNDASLYERLGWPVQVLDAGPANIKVTTPFDLTMAEAVLALRSAG